ncbi:hypothetical protein EMPG_10856 [Blastomyces silverae]|uniref:Uncharacterized protein n=1 Tax=Blastomyces silverae TaxID=2060906 RepID=A0A0H1B3N3_9EURO|nr:hypothetical protein EMPG_10856 [Blastomyces silverae]
MLFTSPTSLVNANILRNSSSIFTRHVAQQPVAAALDGWPPLVLDAFTPQQAAQAAQPPLPRLVLLVFSAVLEVVCISLPGYIVARMGMFDADAQKFVANLNVVLFTPCLVFTKLASQLTADKLTDLAIIPCIFVIQTLISYLCAAVVSRLFRFKKRQSNFVIAMGVFGNSNSLPISLILSLSHTLEGLHWDRVPNDSDDEVGARGILYLLIFQQLGQLLRWSWGYRVLLAPPETYYRDEEERDASRIRVSEPYTDEPDDVVGHGHGQTLIDTTDDHNTGHDTPSASSSSGNVSHFESGGETPIMARQYSFTKLAAMDDSGEVEPEQEDQDQYPSSPVLHLPPPNGQFLPRQSSTGAITLFPAVEPQLQPQQPSSTWRHPLQKFSKHLKSTYHTLISSLHNRSKNLFHALPLPLQNPDTFIKNSVTRAVEQNGNVAVPLILVVLGANLARNTHPNNTSSTTTTLTGKRSHDGTHDPYPREERNLIIASLVARMLLPTLIMSPILALAAKYVPVSILDDPIFVVVCFLLTGAPSALQLAQICQLNNVYMGAMARLLFQSYVVWILPSTLILVILALQVVQWATAT